MNGRGAMVVWVDAQCNPCVDSPGNERLLWWGFDMQAAVVAGSRLHRQCSAVCVWRLCKNSLLQAPSYRYKRAGSAAL